ncbi:MAG: DUF3089 domain-containing protein [Actinomycetota bacterium]|nr:DUF3089 domain-containing protein [Actinomycetota bacterium]
MRVDLGKVVAILTGAIALAPCGWAGPDAADGKPSAERRAEANVAWLCRPGLESNPCVGDQTTRYFEPDGSSRVGRPEVPANPPIDCFYVYPGVSNQPTPNATKSADPEIRSIAQYQAQRFSTRCRVYAPLYRQVTAAGIAIASQTRDTSGYDTAFGDVREAWFEYLRAHNHGRGFVLLGHSQGARILRALIRREIDGNPAVRARLVAAMLPGANVSVAKGRRVGGDFANVPACESATQTGCVIAYSTFNSAPPRNARFGRTDTDPFGGALGLPSGPEVEPLCTNPAARTGGGLESLQPSEPFAPGAWATMLAKTYGGPPPSADTPWLQPLDHYTGRCEGFDGANVLMISPVAGARTLSPSPDDTWGLHVVDVSIALGNLVTIVGEQTRAWVADRRPLRARLRGRRTSRGAMDLTATVTGPPRRKLRVTLRREGHRVARRRTRLDRAGRARARFRVRYSGCYRVSVRTVAGRVDRVRSRRLCLRLRRTEGGA